MQLCLLKVVLTVKNKAVWGTKLIVLLSLSKNGCKSIYHSFLLQNFYAKHFLLNKFQKLRKTAYQKIFHSWENIDIFTCALDNQVHLRSLD